VSVRASRRAARVRAWLRDWSTVGGLIAFVIAMAFNVLSARDSAISAEASARSAAATEESVRIESAPALTLRCVAGVRGNADYEILIGWPGWPLKRSVQKFEHSPFREFDYETCTLSNFGRLPALNVRVSFKAALSKAPADRFSRPGAAAEAVETYDAEIDGVGAQSSVTIWIHNESQKTQAIIYPDPIAHFKVPPNDAEVTYSLPLSFEIPVVLRPARAQAPPTEKN